MNTQCLVPLIATIAYIPLLAILLFNRPWQKPHKLLIAYLAVAMVWSLSDFFLRSNFFVEDKIILFRLVICAGLWSGIQLYSFCIDPVASWSDLAMAS